MKRYIVATIKSWNIDNYYKLQKEHPEAELRLITQKEELTLELLSSFRPNYVFFPHWSWIIPPDVCDSYNCVVFHMTDLPFGRGGSPMQNLIVRGIYDTKISAIKAGIGVDTGPIYFKEPVNIAEGNADDIFSRISGIIFGKMIPRFLNEELIPVEQIGEVVSFKRRKPEQSEIPDGLSQRQIYDYIRMLDGEGYPTAYKKYNSGRIFFTDAKFEDGVVTAMAHFWEEHS
ncbi:MAG: methionyl-tRNA formyltransferase [Lachnospiraceae bacterium]|nr:methionyl-tRNA formyltransferase [Lachnospiraceae bacterium]